MSELNSCLPAMLLLLLLLAVLLGASSVESSTLSGFAWFLLRNSGLRALFLGGGCCPWGTILRPAAVSVTLPSALFFFVVFPWALLLTACPLPSPLRPLLPMHRSSAVAAGAVMDATAAPDAAEVPDVDAAQPATTLQIRLHDGRRVRAQLNMHHTVRHIQAIIARFAHPETACRVSMK